MRRPKSKKLKCSNILPASIGGEDRISNLPSCLIVKIISLLPTKDAVVTSALSTKWKLFWTLVTKLDFDDTTADHVQGVEMRFKRFVNQVLLRLDKSCLEKFRLKCKGHYKGSLVNEWIASVLMSNVQEIDLSVPIKQPVLLPSDIFLCKTLVTLKLDAKGEVNIPTSICLPILKTLHLNKIKFPDDVSIVRLLSGCPVLEELRLSHCLGKDARIINVISPTLTTLTVECLPFDVPRSPCSNLRIELDTPSLKHLNVGGYLVGGYSLKNINNLIRAEIDIGVPRFAERKVLNNTFTKALTDIFNAISQVQSLSLSKKSMEVIRFNPVLPEFSNLTYLEINPLCFVGFDALETLLEGTPCLETLHLRQGEYQFFRNGNHHHHVVPPCLLSHLKFIIIDDFGGDEIEMDMVKHMLKNGLVLEKVTLRYLRFDLEEEATIYHQLIRFQIASPICEVDFDAHELFSESFCEESSL